jgi:hypothetical protein
MHNGDGTTSGWENPVFHFTATMKDLASLIYDKVVNVALHAEVDTAINEELSHLTHYRDGLPTIIEMFALT